MKIAPVLTTLSLVLLATPAFADISGGGGGGGGGCSVGGANVVSALSGLAVFGTVIGARAISRRLGKGK